MDRVKRIWYLSPMRAAKVHGEPAHPRSLARPFAACSYKQWVKRNFQTESKIPGLWMAGHAQLKFVMTECSKTQIRLTGLRFVQKFKSWDHTTINRELWSPKDKNKPFFFLFYHLYLFIYSDSLLENYFKLVWQFADIKAWSYMNKVKR